ncbi:unnamed protein product [Parajaminaea phylloscopi]
MQKALPDFATGRIRDYVAGINFIYTESPYWRAITSQTPILAAFGVGALLSIVTLLYINWGKAKPTLDPTTWQRFPLIEKKVMSPNTAQYRFALPKKHSMLGLPIGQHLQIQTDVNGKKVQRSYTPITSDDELGFFELMIKTYPQGAVSSYIGELKIGDYIEVKGPKGQMRYHSELTRKIGMIAGGTGITPCLQIIQQVLKDQDDNTTINFIYANVKEEDILMKKELDELASKHKQFKVWYFLNEAPDNWKGGKGFITKEAIQDFLPEPAHDSKILMCGPPPMIDACKKHLDELGFAKPRAVSKMEDQVFCF